MITSGLVGFKAEIFTALYIEHLSRSNEKEQEQRCLDWRSFLGGDVLLKLEKLVVSNFLVAVQTSLDSTVGEFEEKDILQCASNKAMALLQSNIFATSTRTSGSSNVADIVCGASTWYIKDCAGINVLCVADSDNTDARSACENHRKVCQGQVVAPGAIVIAPCSAGGVEAGLTHMAVDFEDKAPPPKVTGISVSSPLRTVLTLRVAAIIAPGSTNNRVHCLAFVDGSGNAAPTETRLTSSFLYNTGTSATVDSGIAHLNITDLPAATRFQVYCTSSSADGSLLGIELVEANRAEGTTMCCKHLLVQIVQSTVLQGGEVDVISYAQVDSLPRVGIIRIDPYIEHMSVGTLHRNDHGLFPTNFVVDQNTPVGKNLKFSWSDFSNTLVSGQYRIGASISGATARDYTLVFPGGLDTFTMLSNVKPLPPPSVSAAQFSPDGAYVDVILSTMSDRGLFETRRELGAHFPCNEALYLRYSGHGGDVEAFVNDVAECSWVAANIVRVFAPTTSLELIPAVSTVGLAATAMLRAQCPETQTIEYCGTWLTSNQTTVDNAVPIAVPLTPLAPVVKLQGPVNVGPCDTFDLILGASTGSGGRAWKSATATVDSPGLDAESLAAIVDFFEQSPFGVDALQIEVHAAGLLVELHEYIFSFTLCNFLDACTTRVHHTYVQNSVDKPTVLISGGSYREVSRSRELFVTADAYVSVCDGSRDRSGLRFAWKVLLDGVTQDDMASVSRNSRHFLLPAFMLLPLMTYEVKVTVTSESRAGAVSTSTIVHIVPGELKAIISRSDSSSTGSDVPLKPGMSLMLSALESYDTDYPATVESSSSSIVHDFDFEWTCEQRKPFRSSECSFDLLRHKQRPEMILEYGSNRSANTTSILTLKVSLADRASETTLIIRAADSAAPTVGIFTTDATISSGAKALVKSSRLVISGSIEFENYLDSGEVSWDVSPPIRGFMLPGKALLRPSNPDSFLRYARLVVPAHSDMDVGILYTFTMKCTLPTGKESHSSLTVRTNVPPSPGQFFVSPASGGVELSQAYSYQALYWVDDDVPLLLSYSFGYKDRDGRLITTRSRLVDEPRASVLLPAVSDVARGNRVTCVAFIFDALDANSTAEFTVEVLPAASSGNAEDKVTDLLRVLNDVLTPIESDGLSSDPELFKNVISAVSTALDIVDCTLPYKVLSVGGCANINRRACSKTEGTCGPCLAADMLGEFGDANSACIDVSLNPDIGENDGGGDDGRGDFVVPDKECPADGTCSGHGVCVTSGKGLDSPSASCAVTDATCTRTCACDSGFKGHSCSYSDARFADRLSLKEDLIKSLKNLTQIEDVSSTGLAQQATTLLSMTAKTDELTDTSKRAAIGMVGSMLDALMDARDFDSSVTAGTAMSILESTFLAKWGQSSIPDDNDDVDYDGGGGDVRDVRRSDARLLWRRFLQASGDSDEDAGVVNRALKHISQLELRNAVPDQSPVVSIHQGSSSIVRALSAGALFADGRSIDMVSPLSSMDVQNGKHPALVVSLPTETYRETGSITDFNLNMALRATTPLKTFPRGESTLSQTVSFEATVSDADCSGESASLPVLLTVLHNTPVKVVEEANTFIQVKCREGWPENGTVACPFGSHPVNCSGEVDYVQNVTCPKRLFSPNCGNGDSFLERVCTVARATSDNTTCLCDLCLARMLAVGSDGRRRLFGVEDSGFVEITAMSRFILSDALDVMIESGDFTSTQALAEARLVLSAFAAAWVGMALLVLTSELYNRRKITNDGKKKAPFHAIMDEYIQEQYRSGRLGRSQRKYQSGYSGNSIWDIFSSGGKVQPTVTISQLASDQDTAIANFVRIKSAEVLEKESSDLDNWMEDDVQRDDGMGLDVFKSTPRRDIGVSGRSVALVSVGIRMATAARVLSLARVSKQRKITSSTMVHSTDAFAAFTADSNDSDDEGDHRQTRSRASSSVSSPSLSSSSSSTSDGGMSTPASSRPATTSTMPASPRPTTGKSTRKKSTVVSVFDSDSDVDSEWSWDSVGCGTTRPAEAVSAKGSTKGSERPAESAVDKIKHEMDAVRAELTGMRLKAERGIEKSMVEIESSTPIPTPVPSKTKKGKTTSVGDRETRRPSLLSPPHSGSDIISNGDSSEDDSSDGSSSSIVDGTGNAISTAALHDSSKQRRRSRKKAKKAKANVKMKMKAKAKAERAPAPGSRKQYDRRKARKAEHKEALAERIRARMQVMLADSHSAVGDEKDGDLRSNMTSIRNLVLQTASKNHEERRDVKPIERLQKGVSHLSTMIQSVSAFSSASKHAVHAEGRLKDDSTLAPSPSPISSPSAKKLKELTKKQMLQVVPVPVTDVADSDMKCAAKAMRKKLALAEVGSAQRHDNGNSHGNNDQASVLLFIEKGDAEESLDGTPVNKQNNKGNGEGEDEDDYEDESESEMRQRLQLRSLKRLISDYFPGTFATMERYKRLAKELRAYQGVVVLFSTDSLIVRCALALEILTIASTSVLSLALVFSLQYPVDDGSCEPLSRLGEEACLKRMSMFNSEETFCSFSPPVTDLDATNELSGKCQWEEPLYDIVTTVRVLIVVIIFTAPFMVTVNWIFKYVLRAPNTDHTVNERFEYEAMRAVIRLKNNHEVERARGQGEGQSERQRRGADAKKGVPLSSHLGLLHDYRPPSSLNENTIRGLMATGASARRLGVLHKMESSDLGVAGNSLVHGMGEGAFQQTIVLHRDFDQRNRIACCLIAGTANLEEEFDGMKRSRAQSALTKAMEQLAAKKRNDAKLLHRSDNANAQATVQLPRPSAMYDILEERVLRARSRFAMIRTAMKNGALRMAAQEDVDDAEGSEHLELLRWSDDNPSICTVTFPHQRTVDAEFMVHYRALALELEAYVCEFRRTIRKNGDRREFDRQWGIHKHLARRTMSWKNHMFIAFRLAECLHIKRIHMATISKLSNNAAAAYLIMLFTGDLLGRTSCRANAFRVKANEVFASKHTMPQSMKLAAVFFFLCYNIFVVWFCAANGRDKSHQWQIDWLSVCVFKIVLDLGVAQFLEIVVLRFYVPEFCLKEVQQVKTVLYKGAAELVKPNHSYRLKMFSASDYFNVSSFVARSLPDMIESKLVLMHRSPLPGELGCDPPSERVNWNAMGFREVVSHTCVVLVLTFGGLPDPVQKVFIQSIPTVIVSGIAFMFVNLKRAGDEVYFFILSLGLVCAAVATYMLVKPLYRTVFRSNLEPDIHDNVVSRSFQTVF
jgi:hypothetical protein